MLFYIVEKATGAIAYIGQESEVPQLETYVGIPVEDLPEGTLVGDVVDFNTMTTSPAPTTPLVPEAVTARQARLALLGAGKLAMVEGALAQIPGVQGEAARIEWEYATDIRRDSPLIGALAPMLGLTSEQVDDLFRAAEGL